MPSFDIQSKVDGQTLDNAVNVVKKEILNRWDFKGTHVSIELDKITIQYLTRMSNGTKDKCFICSKSDHFAKDCSKKNVFTVVHNQNYNKKIIEIIAIATAQLSCC